MSRLFHRTSQANAAQILKDGFRDMRGSYGTHCEGTGVWVSDRPLDANEGANGDTLLSIDLPCSESELAEFEWVEDGKSYREFLIPALLINERGRVEIIEDNYLNEDESDKSLAHRLLNGWYVYDEKDRPQRREYFKAGEEQEARAALARLLRSGTINQHLLDTLANLFEGVERFPSHPDYTPAFERRLIFKHHKKQPDAIRRTESATFVWKLRKQGKPIKSCVTAAMKHYDLKCTQVEEIWRHYKPVFERDPSLAGD